MFIDVKYCNLISNQLELFKLKESNPYTAQCRCPICGDSQKNKRKMRGYFYTRKNMLYYYCHNCNISLTFGSFLKEVNYSMYEDYKLERYREGLDLHKLPHSKPSQRFDFAPKFKEKDFFEQNLTRLDKLDETNLAYAYAVSRMIPRELFSRLYYVENMKGLETIHEKYKGKFNEGEKRLAIPFYNSAGDAVGLSCRALGSSKLKYITIKFSEDVDLLYNIQSVNRNDRIYCVEGPIDSMFLKNSVAVGGTNIKKVEKLLPKEKCTLVYDNQPRNETVVKIMTEAAKLGYSMCVWENMNDCKDINDMVLSGITLSQIREYIDNHTYTGLALQEKIRQWKKV